MKRPVRGWGLRLAFVLTAAASLAACNGDNSPLSQAASSSTTTSSANHAPEISGAAPGDVVAGQSYSFTPTATDADSDALTFTITNKPGWAAFDTSTGRLSGTPTNAQAGSYPNIEIAATDGQAVAMLSFAITVSAAPASEGAVTLSWLPPTENTDGSPIATLTGYKIHYGTESGSYTDVITVSNAGITRYVIDNLPAGKYYFAITAYTSTGAESAYSGEASTTIG
jgi:Putative Ig domain